MYGQRTGLLLFIVAVFGTILQLIGLFTSGWNFLTSVFSDWSSSNGLWSSTLCDDGGTNCETTTYYEQYTKMSQIYPKTIAGNVLNNLNTNGKYTSIFFGSSIVFCHHISAKIKLYQIKFSENNIAYVKHMLSNCVMQSFPLFVKYFFN